MVDMPYFMENSDWFEFDAKTGKYVLTADAPDKAVQSYTDYYKEVESEND